MLVLPRRHQLVPSLRPSPERPEPPRFSPPLHDDVRLRTTVHSIMTLIRDDQIRAGPAGSFGGARASVRRRDSRISHRFEKIPAMVDRSSSRTGRYGLPEAEV